MVWIKTTSGNIKKYPYCHKCGFKFESAFQVGAVGELSGKLICVECAEKEFNKNIIKPDKNKSAFKLFPEKYEAIESGLCSVCFNKIDKSEFKDELSKKEFSISGMCMSCQNKTFIEEETY